MWSTSYLKICIQKCKLKLKGHRIECSYIKQIILTIHCIEDYYNSKPVLYLVIWTKKGTQIGCGLWSRFKYNLYTVLLYFQNRFGPGTKWIGLVQIILDSNKSNFYTTEFCLLDHIQNVLNLQMDAA